MSHTINLKEIERKAFRSTFQDGLWDIYLGLLLLVMGVGPVLYNIGVPVLWILLTMIALAMLTLVAFRTGKKLITVPRMGLVEFGSKGKARKKKAAIVFTISIFVGIILFIGALVMYSSSLGRQNLGLAIAIVGSLGLIIVFGLGAYFLEFERLYLIGVLYALPLPLLILVDKLFGVDLGFWSTALPASIILIIGMVIFLRFLHNYPIPDEALFLKEDVDGSR